VDPLTKIISMIERALVTNGTHIQMRMRVSPELYNQLTAATPGEGDFFVNVKSHAVPVVKDGNVDTYVLEVSRAHV
jgi:hypothetical protein